MKGGIYIRISTTEQSSFSLKAQQEQLENYCKQNRIDVYKVYSDIKGRFSFEERKGLMNLLDDIEKGRINVLLVTELDRLSGDEGILGYVKLTLRKYNVELISINEKDKVRNEYQELVDTILTAIAKFELKRKKLRCRRGLKKARELGKGTNRIAFGYRYQNKEVIVDKENSKIIKEIFNRYVHRKQSVYAISKEMQLSKPNVKYYLKNKFYVDPNLYCKHKPIIDIKLFELAKEKLSLNS